MNLAKYNISMNQSPQQQQTSRITIRPQTPVTTFIPAPIIPAQVPSMKSVVPQANSFHPSLLQL